MLVETTSVRSILTRTSGYLRTVTSHSLQPYRGCSFGLALCGVGCYVRHNQHLLRGREWGRFLEARTNAAAAYREAYDRERRWARRARGRFSVFLSSSTEPFLPQEERLGITRAVLDAMLELPPDLLILQTHSHAVAASAGRIARLAEHCELRVHLSIETDRERIAGLPAHASSVASRFEAARRLRAAGIRTVITVSPLLPIRDPETFFAEIAESADAVVIDHFVGGDGSPGGARTWRTPLPAAMAAVEPGTPDIAYRDAMVAVARRHLPGRAGVSIDGFAGRYLAAP